MRLLDPRFKYIPAARTDVTATWRRFGFRPTTDAERRSRKSRDDDSDVGEARVVVQRRQRRPNLKLAATE